MRKAEKDISNEIVVRKAELNDAPVLCCIYNHYVEHTIVTFDLELKSEEVFRLEMEQIMKSYPYLVLVHNNVICGYACGNAWKIRKAYRQCVESSVYLEPGEKGRGYGKILYSALMAELKNSGIHSVIAGISMPNEESIRLHEKLGFEKIGHFREVGWKFGKWIDVAYWELIFTEKTNNI